MKDDLTLIDLPIGARAIVTKIQTDDEGITRHLMAMGVMQGVNIVIENRFPSYVVKVGRSRAAFDTETAKTIYVTQDFN